MAYEEKGLVDHIRTWMCLLKMSPSPRSCFYSSLREILHCVFHVLFSGIDLALTPLRVSKCPFFSFSFFPLFFYSSKQILRLSVQW